MNDLDNAILDILKKSLAGEPVTQMDDWTGVLKELKDQAIFCLPYASIRKGGCLSEKDLQSYQMLCYQSIAKNMQLLNEQKEMIELFENNNIPVVVLKGAAAASYYPYQPESRMMGDIDIIVKPEDFDGAMQLLHQYYACNQTLEMNPRHIGFTSKNQVEIELHKYFSFGDRTEKKLLLDQMIYDGIDRREWREVHGYRIPCLPFIESGLVLLSHIYQHLYGSGIGYRQIMDFAAFVEAEKENIPAFMSAAERVGLSGLAEALIHFYDRYLGVHTDLGTVEVNELALKQLMDAFMHAGNFGRKESMDGGKRSEIVLRTAKNPIEMIKKLQHNGRVHWKKTEKYVFLRPFAWIYQIGYYINQVRINGGLSVIVKGRKRLTDKEKMFKALGLD